MTNTDPIADFINRLQSGSAVGKQCVLAPHSKVKYSIAKVLEKEGFVGRVSKKGKKIQKSIEVELAYDEGAPKIHKAKRISKPSKRIYYSQSDIRPVLNGFGLLILSTPEGIMSGKDARKKKIGGEALFTIT